MKTARDWVDWFKSLVTVRDLIFLFIGVGLCLVVCWKLYNYEMYRAVKLGNFLYADQGYKVTVQTTVNVVNEK